MTKRGEGEMNEFPESDAEFQEYILEKVRKGADGSYELSFDGCLGCWSGDNNPIEPKVGMVMRQYGKGFGSYIRGIFIDGVKFYYRTPEEDDVYRERQQYGADASEWLSRWDDGKSVWSISMGGIGPGYEQAIQVTTAEILRHLLSRGYNTAAWEDEEVWKKDRERIDDVLMTSSKVKDMGLSGAQWGAAMNLAAMLYRHGPIHVMKDERVKDRHILVSSRFV